MFTPVLKLEHADERGEIYSITLPDNHEFLLIHSLPGSLRGGHAHTTDEVVVIVTGVMKYRKRFPKAWAPTIPDGSELEVILKAGYDSRNVKGVFHLGEFLEDSWLVEVKSDSKKGASQNIDYPAWRERVNAHKAGRK